MAKMANDFQPFHRNNAFWRGNGCTGAIWHIANHRMLICRQ